MVGALANPVAPVAADEEADDDGHDLETAESLLEIIEKKIAKLIKVNISLRYVSFYLPLISIMPNAFLKIGLCRNVWSMEAANLFTANLITATRQIMATDLAATLATDRVMVVAMHLVVMHLVTVATEVVQDTDINMNAVVLRSFWLLV